MARLNRAVARQHDTVLDGDADGPVDIDAGAGEGIEQFWMRRDADAAPGQFLTDTLMYRHIAASAPQHVGSQQAAE